MRDTQSANIFSPESKKFPWMGYHVGPFICTLGTSHLISVMRFKGVPHETRDQQVLNREFKRLDRCFKALGKQEGRNVMLHTYTFKRRVTLNGEYVFDLPIIQEYADSYLEPFRTGDFREVGYAMALVLKYSDLDDGISRMEDLLNICKVMLAEFGASFLGMEERGGQLYSEIGRFYYSLLNGVDQDVVVTETRLGEAVLDGETGFGAYDYVENRPYSGDTRFATTYDLRTLPKKSSPGMWDELLDVQSDFCLVQTFHFEERNKIKHKLTVQKSDLANTEGESEQTDELEDAIQQVVQGVSVFGLHHASLIAYAETPEKAVARGSDLQNLFKGKGADFVRSTSSNWNTWLTLFPAYQDVIYRSPRSTENLACLFSLHTTPSGKAKGNPLGDGSALMPMATVNGGMYFANLHNSPLGKNSVGKMLPGHTVIKAMTGAGKTTLESAIMIFLSRNDPLVFCIDYNRAMENVMRALKVAYFYITPGEYTGVQFFQWDDSTSLRQTLLDLVSVCAGGMDDEEEQQASMAIDSVFKHVNHGARSFSLFHQYLPNTGVNCLKNRMAKWCRSVQGRTGTGTNAWVLDSPRNLFNPAAFRRMAFDCTQILKSDYVEKHPEETEAVLTTLNFIKKVMHAQSPQSILVTQISEYWAMLMFPKTANMITEVLHAGRMRGEFLIMDTQTPEQALQTKYGASIVQQVVTQIWMANDKANAESYGKFGVKGKEFEKVAELGLYSYEALIKQGNQGAMVSFALSHKTEYWLPLLSATMPNLEVAKNVRNKIGSDDPAQWVKPFLDEMVAIAIQQETGSKDPAVWMPTFLEKMRSYEQIPDPIHLERMKNEA
ncbi:VirB4 family type IV secretion system protein [Pantoea ananatis]|uniref:VirB4 family type IV secretion system protein n=2 Tax=Pantoea ananas TaxID=553 RepID=UPI0021E6E78D|nr:conjugal transfer protein [Pantoea ananatis]MCW0309910.1 Type IV secretion system protein virB4 [Pantoea ananatis]MCW0341608.1 Type IV secretion system protein virB4 [Pantoea ananatis]MCW0360108.1 Type IV secretion system protein virB4 [Pantoea ananatis]MCW1777356.1 conjugal transfer protein [Pantoea ananatis]UYK95567.1 conjugal transfer protein [Pantoea ananatis]